MDDVFRNRLRDIMGLPPEEAGSRPAVMPITGDRVPVPRSKPAVPAPLEDLSKLGTPVKPVEPDDLSSFGTPVDSTMKTIGKNIVEVGKGIPEGAITSIGTALQGAAALDPWQPNTLGGFRDDIANWNTKSPQEKYDTKTRILDSKSGLNGIMRKNVLDKIKAMEEGTLSLDDFAKQFPPKAPTPIPERPFYKAGADVTDLGKNRLPGFLKPAPGYEESFGRTVGTGIGSMVAGAAASVAGGPLVAGALFALQGAGEGLQNAIKAGGSLSQQTQQAALGLPIGLTDLIPMEILFKGLSMAIRRPLIKAVSEIGVQGLIEGFQEGGQQFLQNLVTKYTTKDDQALFAEVGPNAAVGGTVGVLAETLLQLLSPGRRRSGRPAATPPPPDPNAAAAGQPPAGPAGPGGAAPPPAGVTTPATTPPNLPPGGPANVTTPPTGGPPPTNVAPGGGVAGLPPKDQLGPGEQAPWTPEQEDAVLVQMGENPADIKNLQPSYRQSQLDYARANGIKPPAPAPANLAPGVQGPPGPVKDVPGVGAGPGAGPAPTPGGAPVGPGPGPAPGPTPGPGGPIPSGAPTGPGGPTAAPGQPAVPPVPSVPQAKPALPGPTPEQQALLEAAGWDPVDIANMRGLELAQNLKDALQGGIKQPPAKTGPLGQPAVPGGEPALGTPGAPAPAAGASQAPATKPAPTGGATTINLGEGPIAVTPENRQTMIDTLIRQGSNAIDAPRIVDRLMGIQTAAPQATSGQPAAAGSMPTPTLPKIEQGQPALAPTDVYERVKALVLGDQNASLSYVQRKLGLGYNEAATLVGRMQQEGLISPPAPVTGKRTILQPPGAQPTGTNVGGISPAAPTPGGEDLSQFGTPVEAGAGAAPEPKTWVTESGWTATEGPGTKLQRRGPQTPESVKLHDEHKASVAQAKAELAALNQQLAAAPDEASKAKLQEQVDAAVQNVLKLQKAAPGTPEVVPHNLVNAIQDAADARGIALDDDEFDLAALKLHGGAASPDEAIQQALDELVTQDLKDSPDGQAIVQETEPDTEEADIGAVVEAAPGDVAKKGSQAGHGGPLTTSPAQPEPEISGGPAAEAGQAAGGEQEVPDTKGAEAGLERHPDDTGAAKPDEHPAGTGAVDQHPPPADANGRAAGLFRSTFGHSSKNFQHTEIPATPTVDRYWRTTDPATGEWVEYRFHDNGRIKLRDKSDAKPAVEAPTAGTPIQKFAGRFVAGEKFNSILAARRAAKEDGLEGDEKQLDEQIEQAVVIAARQIVRTTAPGRPTYDRLVELYGQQPRLSQRTGESMKDQAYSTPIPLAYLASQAVNASQGYVVEPTAGNGALLLEVDPEEQTTLANEINDNRNDALFDQGFEVKSVDATTPEMQKLAGRHGGADVVLMNPPFGQVFVNGVKQFFKIGDYTTTSVDKAIAMNVLPGMKQNGRAVLIIAGVKPRQGETRQEGYRSDSARKFFTRLYKDYNVVDHYTVDGPLYARQGAAWPVDVIVIDGKGESQRKLPAADVPVLYKSWEELAGKLEKPDGTRIPGKGTEEVRGAGKPGRGPGRSPDGDQRPSGEPGDVAGPAPGAGPKPTQLPVPDIREPNVPGDDQGADGGLRPDGGRDLGGAPEQDNAPGPSPGLDEEDEITRILREENEAYDREEAAKAEAAKPPPSPPAPPKAPAAPKTAGQAAGSAATNVGMGLQEIGQGLLNLFDPKGKVGSGPSFDEETYAKAKPYFQSAVAHFVQAGQDVRTLASALVKFLRGQMQMSAEGVNSMLPYLKRFIEETRAPKQESLEGKEYVGPEFEMQAPQSAESLERKEGPKEKSAEGQVPYVPRSNARSVGAQIPANLKDATEQSLDHIKSVRGDLDHYVATELGYDIAEIPKHFSAEQVDAIAMQLHNMARGGALILGDQTGIGKGRVVAAMIRYGARNGILPIFVTEKPDLYGDMYRDLNNIGSPELAENAFPMMDPKERVALNESAKDWIDEKRQAEAEGLDIPEIPADAKFLRASSRAQMPKDMAAIVSGEKRVTAIFATYSQLQSISGNDTPRRGFINTLMPGAFMILDEAHNAGGQGAKAQVRKKKGTALSVAKWMRMVQEKAKHAFYSSATYAKRPEVMDLYARTDLGQAVDNPADLPNLIAKGGVPLQQVVAGMLARAGQYIRRERTFDGVTYAVEAVPVDKQAYADFTDALRAVYLFDRELDTSGERDGIFTTALDDAGAALGFDPALGEYSADTTGFSSIMHNLIGQMIFSIKAEAVAARAIEALKANEKPIITAAFTMESFLTDYADMAGIKPGQPINISFSDVLKRYLSRTLRVRIKGPNEEEKPVYVQIPVSKLSPEMQARYARVEASLAKPSFDKLPVSPLDIIRARITQAGYKVAEITGRKLMIDYTGDVPKLVARPKSEMGSSGKAATKRSFNNKGGIDALIGNESMSTGISLHASPEEGTDLRPRHMLIAQADPDITTHMQMMGRIHRTGQVELPRYTQIVADIPAETRPTAVLMKKMASLNANTTASRKGMFSTEGADFMNEYGDRVVAAILQDDLRTNARMGMPLRPDEDGDVPVNDAARKVTGRLTMLYPDEQTALIDQIQNDYAALIRHLDEMGTNNLEAKTIDLQAEPISSAPMRVKTGEGPFLDGTNLEQVKAKSPGRAMSTDDIIGNLTDKLRNSMPKVIDPHEPFTVNLDRLQRAGQAELQSTIGRVKTDFKTYLDNALGAFKDPNVKEQQRQRLTRSMTKLENVANLAYPGARITLSAKGNDLQGIVLDVAKTKDAKAVDPAANSTWVVTIAVPDAARTFGIQVSQLEVETAANPDAEGFLISPPDWAIRTPDLPALFEEARKEGKEERSIITGNILAGYDLAKGQGQIVNYTTNTGEIRQGVLLPRGTKPKKFLRDTQVRFRNVDQAWSYLQDPKSTELITTDQESGLILEKNGRENYRLIMSSNKSKAGRYFTDDNLQKAVGGGNRLKKSKSLMVSEPLSAQQAAAVVRALGGLHVQFQSSGNQEAAQAIIASKTGVTVLLPAATRGTTELRIATGGYGGPVKPARNVPKAEFLADKPLMQQISALLTRLVGREVGQAFHDVMPASETPYSNYAEELKAAGGKVAARPGGNFTWDDVSALINIALHDPDYNARTTAFHEAWHAIEFLLLNDAEQKIMRDPRELKRMREYIGKALGMSPEQVAKIPNYEVTALAFQVFMKQAEARLDPMRAGGLHVMVRRAFDRIARIIKELRALLSRNGYSKYEDVFEAASQGKFAGREPRKAPPQSLLETRTPSSGTVEARTPSSAGPLPPRSASETRAERILRRLDPLRIDVQDKFLEVKRLQQEVERRTGQKLAVPLDTYMAEQVGMGGRVAADEADINANHIEPFIRAMREEGVDREDIDAYVFAKHAPERNAVTRQRDPSNDQGSGMSDADAQALLDRLTADPVQAAKLERLAERVYAMGEERLDILQAGGLINQDQRDAWNEPYQFYVPMRGTDGDPEADQENQPRVGRRLDIRGRESKAVTGRYSLPDSPLVYTMTQLIEANRRAGKNRVLQTFGRFARAHPNPEHYRMARPHMEPYIGADGLRHERLVRPPFGKHANRFIGYKVGGKQIYIEALNPKLLKAFQNMGAEMHVALRILAKFLRVWSGLQTSYNPDFVAVNFTRDIEGAMISMGDVPELRGKGARRKLLTESFKLKNVRGIWRALRNPNNHNHRTTSRFYEDFRHDGGQVSYLDSVTVQSTKDKIDRLLNEGRVEHAWRAAIKFVDDIGTSIENNVRLSVYIRMRQAGVPRPRAAQAARDITVDFNRRGALGGYMSAGWAFLNANIQGLANALRMLGSPKAGKLVLRGAISLIGAGFLMEFVNTLMGAIGGGDDDDDKKKLNEYDQVQDYEHQNNAVIMLPDGSGNYVKLPLPFVFGFFYQLGREGMRTLMGKQGPGEMTVNTVAAAGQNLNFMGQAGSALEWILPTFLDPLAQILGNVNFFGGQIHPKDFDARKPKSETLHAGTPGLYHDLAATLNRLTGGNTARPGGIDWYPENIQHVVEFASGGLGRFMTGAWMTGLHAYEGEEQEPRQWPIVKRFFGTTRSKTAAANAWYEGWNVVDAANYEVSQLRKQGLKTEATAAKGRLSHELSAYTAMKAIDNQIDDRRQELKRLRSSGLKADDPKIKEKEDKLTALYRRGATIFATKMKGAPSPTAEIAPDETPAETPAEAPETDIFSDDDTEDLGGGAGADRLVDLKENKPAAKPAAKAAVGGGYTPAPAPFKGLEDAVAGRPTPGLPPKPDEPVQGPSAPPPPAAGPPPGGYKVAPPRIEGPATDVFGQPLDADSQLRREMDPSFQSFPTRKPDEIIAPVLDEYPMAGEVAGARKAGFGYGTGLESYLAGEQANVLYDYPGGKPVSAVGRDPDFMYEDRKTGKIRPYVTRGSTQIKPAPEGHADIMTAGALAANRHPLASLGFDPSVMSFDTQTDRSRANLGGAYFKKADEIFAITGGPPGLPTEPGGRDDQASIVHESIHRGFKMLQEGPNAVTVPKGFDDEYLVREIMRRYMGDVERGAGGIYLDDKGKQYDSQRERAQRMFSRKEMDKLLADITAAAAQEVKRRRPERFAR